MAILILYATVEGHSRTIAEHAAGLLEARGHKVVIGDMREPGFAVPGRFEGILLCAPIHVGRYPEPLLRFVTDWKEALDDVPNAFISVSLAIASDSEEERAEARSYPAVLENTAGYRPRLVHHAAGALKYVEYDFFKRMMMRRIAAKEGGPVDTGRDHVLTDWDALNAFVKEFSNLIGSEQGGKSPAM